MFYFLAQYRDLFGPLRLFEYVTFRAGGALFCSMLITLALGPLTIKLLNRFRTMAPNRYEGFTDEKDIDRDKDDVPSMGGLLIVAAIVVSTLLWAELTLPVVRVFLSVLLVLAGVGFIDDYRKIKYGRDGLPGRFKLLVQFALALVAVYFLDCLSETTIIDMSPDGLGGVRHISREIMLPLFKNAVATMPLWLSMLCGAVVMVGSSNAVNLTDGKDGLATGCMVIAALAFTVFAYLSGHRIFAEYLMIPHINTASEVVVFACAIVGACLGFLWFNCYPASMFMGDTGSLALGGVLAMLAILVKQEIALIIVGGVFVIEAFSVILQVGYFKITKRFCIEGKRIFRRTPIHHHFERNWDETQIVTRFWIIAIICALIGLATLKLR